jgi:hypothetical protein
MKIITILGSPRKKGNTAKVLSMFEDEKDKESNWLPSTASGMFLLIMRTYMPGEDIVEQKWAPPPVVEVAQ